MAAVNKYQKGRRKIDVNLKEVEKLTLAGLSHIQVAEGIGLSKSALYSVRYEHVMHTIRKAEDKLRAMVSKALLDGAQRGDTAMTIFLAKRLNIHKVSYHMPQIKSTSGALKSLSMIQKDLASGKITPELANNLTKVIKEFLNAFEINVLEKRLDEIEARLDANN